MTFNEIEKEFDEKFTYLGRNQIDQQEILINPYTTPEKFKSFLKQSFIKYLQKDLEQAKENIEAIVGIDNDFARGMRYEMQSRINTLQAQIKELEV